MERDEVKCRNYMSEVIPSELSLRNMGLQVYKCKGEPYGRQSTILDGVDLDTYFEVNVPGPEPGYSEQPYEGCGIHVNGELISQIMPEEEMEQVEALIRDRLWKHRCEIYDIHEHGESYDIPQTTMEGGQVKKFYPGHHIHVECQSMCPEDFRKMLKDVTEWWDVHQYGVDPWKQAKREYERKYASGQRTLRGVLY